MKKKKTTYIRIFLISCVITIIMIFLTSCSGTREQYSIQFDSGEKLKYEKFILYKKTGDEFLEVETNDDQEERIVDIISSLKKETGDNISLNDSEIYYRIIFNDKDSIDIYENKKGKAVLNTDDECKGAYSNSKNIIKLIGDVLDE